MAKVLTDILKFPKIKAKSKEKKRQKQIPNVVKKISFELLRERKYPNIVHLINFKKETLQPVFIKVRIVAIFMVAIFCLLASSVYAYQNFYDGVIYPGVKVLGVNLGGNTKREAALILDQKLSNLSVTIKSDKEELKPKLGDLGFSYNIKEVVAQAYIQGRNGDIFSNIKTQFLTLVRKNNSIDLSYNLDQQKFEKYLSSLSSKFDITFKNASLVVENGEIKVTPASSGQKVNITSVKNSILNSLNSLSSTRVNLVIEKVNPTIIETDTSEARAIAENWLNKEIVLKKDDRVFRPGPTEIGSWLTFPEITDQGAKPKLGVDVSADKIYGFVNWVASEVNIPAVDKVVYIENEKESVTQEGKSGLAVDVNNVVTQVKNSFGSSQSFVMDLPMYNIDPKLVVNRAIVYDWAKYIDVNLSTQTLVAFENKNQVFSTLVSTGLTGPTPVGTFPIYSKNESVLMAGADYYLPNVQWVSWFTGPYSIHGTYWHNNFGHPMSHGCVNLPNDAAYWVYMWAPVGTPVVIHW